MSTVTGLPDDAKTAQPVTRTIPASTTAHTAQNNPRCDMLTHPRSPRPHDAPASTAAHPLAQARACGTTVAT